VDELQMDNYASYEAAFDSAVENARRIGMTIMDGMDGCYVIYRTLVIHEFLNDVTGNNKSVAAFVDWLFGPELKEYHDAMGELLELGSFENLHANFISEVC
jgi:hypothetical protein